MKLKQPRWLFIDNYSPGCDLTCSCADRLDWAAAAVDWLEWVNVHPSGWDDTDTLEWSEVDLAGSGASDSFGWDDKAPLVCTGVDDICWGDADPFSWGDSGRLSKGVEESWLDRADEWGRGGVPPWEMLQPSLFESCSLEDCNICPTGMTLFTIIEMDKTAHNATVMINRITTMLIPSCFPDSTISSFGISLAKAEVGVIDVLSSPDTDFSSSFTSIVVFLPAFWTVDEVLEVL